MIFLFCFVVRERERERDLLLKDLDHKEKSFLFFLFYNFVLSMLIFGYNLIIPTLRPSFLIVYSLTSSPLFID